MRDGRPPEDGPGKTRSERLTVRLTADDIEGMDAVRGEEAKSDFARSAIRDEITRRRAT